jgi:ATP-dependent Clp protease, protease subunit
MSKDLYSEESQKKTEAPIEITIEKTPPDLHELENGLSIDDSLVYLTGPIDEFSLIDIIVKCRIVLNNRDEEKAKLPINLVIDSFGGCAFSALGIIDYMENLEVPVNTICRGKAMSAGALILVSGTGTRYASKRSSIMLHQGMGTTSGKIGDLKSTADHYTKIDIMIGEILEEYTKKPAKWWAQETSHDKYFTAQEALEVGIIDEIG